jgi:hypothetical protein
MAIPTNDNLKRKADELGIPPFLQSLLGIDSNDPTNVNVGMGVVGPVGAVVKHAVPGGVITKYTGRDIHQAANEALKQFPNASPEVKDAIRRMFDWANKSGQVQAIWDVNAPADSVLSIRDALGSGESDRLWRSAVTSGEAPGVLNQDTGEAMIFRQPYLQDYTKSPQDSARTMIHEVAGHATFRNFMPWVNKMDNARKPPYWQAERDLQSLAKQTNPDAAKAIESDYAGKHGATITGEFLPYWLTYALDDPQYFRQIPQSLIDARTGKVPVRK